MAFLDLLRTIWSNLNRMRVRVLLTAVGVVIGTAAVLVLVSLGAGLQRSATQDIGGISDLTVIRVFAGDSGVSAAQPNGSRAAVSGQPQGLTLKALESLAALPGVVAVTPQESFNGPIQLKLNRLQGYGNVTGVTPQALPLLGYTLASGSDRINRGEAVVGAQIGSNFSDPRSPNPGGPVLRPGQTDTRQTIDLQDASLTLEAQRFANDGTTGTRTLRVRVIGVLAQSGEADFNVYLPLRDVEDLNQWFNGSRVDRTKQGYQQALVKVADTNDVADVQRQIRDLGLNSFSPQDALRSINTFFLVLQAILGGIGAIALLVAAFGIANTLSMAIYERTREIGLMKAVGARNRDVMSIFLGEAAAIGFTGGVAGTLVGWGVSRVVDLIVQNLLAQQGGLFGGGGPSSIVYTPAWLIPFAVVFATLVGLLSGVFPALRAATLDPLKALKYE